MVSAQVVVRELGIPRSTLYRLVDEQKIPAHSVRKPWHQRDRLMFSVAEVKAALERLSADAS